MWMSGEQDKESKPNNGGEPGDFSAIPAEGRVARGVQQSFQSDGKEVGLDVFVASSRVQALILESCMPRTERAEQETFWLPARIHNFHG